MGVLAQVVRVWDLREVADVYHFTVPRAAQALLRNVNWLRYARVVMARYLTDALVAFGGRLKSARSLGGRLLLARFVAPLLSVSLRVKSHQKYFRKRQLLEGRRHPGLDRFLVNQIDLQRKRLAGQLLLGYSLGFE